jgi:polar amino acid transport system substrate-binding protein
VTLALNAQIQNCTYARILTRRGLTSEAIMLSRTNPSGLPKS